MTAATTAANGNTPTAETAELGARLDRASEALAAIDEGLSTIRRMTTELAAKLEAVRPVIEDARRFLAREQSRE
jgi:hypothetical protein